MDPIFQVILSNSIAALLLAAVALLVGRLYRRPQVTHWLCVLVLVKLVTPPVVRVPLSWPAARAVPDVAQSDSARPKPAATAIAGAGGGDPAKPTDAVANQVHPEPPSPTAAVSSKHTTQVSSRVDLLATIPWFGMAGLLWGSTWIRVRRFGRLIRCCTPAGPDQQARVEQLARRLGLRRAPIVLLSPAPVPPLLWAVGLRARLVIPEALWERLDNDQCDALLVHELAHLKRRDHWVRFLEIAVIGLYWWHPVVWWARQSLREAEEQCCDDWVVWTLAGRAKAYARTLLETVDFLAEAPVIEPLGASGLIEESQLKRRLVRILSEASSGRLTRAGSLCMIGLTAASLFAGPLLRTREPTYQVLDLGSLGGRVTRGAKLSSLGQVIGYSSQSHGDPYATPDLHAFRTQPDRPIDPTADDLTAMIVSSDPRWKTVRVHAIDINSSGQTLLEIYGEPGGDPDRLFHGFLLDGDRLIDFDTDPSLMKPMTSTINDVGQVVGSAARLRPIPGATRSAWPYDPLCYRTKAGQLPDLAQDELGHLGGHHAIASDINRSGQVVGESKTPQGLWHAFRTAPDRAIDPLTDDLGTLGGAQSGAYALNDLGQVVGSSFVAGSEQSRHAFRTAPNRPINPSTDDLGTLGGDTSGASAINNRGDTVGSSSTTADQKFHAFLYTADRMIDLNTLVPLDEGWTLQAARDINDRGQILVIAERFDGGKLTPFGRVSGSTKMFPPLIHSVRTLVLTPEPDLAPLAMLVVGTAITGSGLAWSRSRRAGATGWIRRLLDLLNPIRSFMK